jgi:hypothetical protein
MFWPDDRASTKKWPIRGPGIAKGPIADTEDAAAVDPIVLKKSALCAG